MRLPLHRELHNVRRAAAAAPSGRRSRLLLRRLKRDNPDIEKSIFNSIHAVCLDTMVGYKTGGHEYDFHEIYKTRGE